MGASLYWVGNGANWSSTNWATTSGGAPGHVAPTSTDDVFFDANSPGNCTVDVTSSCQSLDCLGFTHTLTLDATHQLTLFGTLLRFVAGMTLTANSAGSINFSATSGTTTNVYSGGQTLPWIGCNGGGQTVVLQDALTQFSASTFVLNNGTLNTNGQTCTWGAFASSNTNTRTLTLGASAITCVNSWSINTQTGLTITANTCTLTLSASGAVFAHVGATNGMTVNMPGGGAALVGIPGSNSPTVTNFSYTGAAVKTDTLTLRANALTVTGTLTLTGNSAVNRPLVQSNTVGTTATITAAAVSITNCDFMDTTGAGLAAPFTGTSLGDCQGNSGITFTASATQTWSGNTTGNWSTVGNWTSRVPLPQDDVAISGLTSGTVTADMPRIGRSINFTGSTGGTFSSSNALFYGSLTFATGLAVTGGSLQGMSRSLATITTNGVSLSLGLVIGQVGVYQLGSNLTISVAISNTYALQLSSSAGSGGSFNANGFNVTVSSYNTQGGTTTTMGAGTWTITGADNAAPVRHAWDSSNAPTINAGTSTLRFTDTSASPKTFFPNGSTSGKTFNVVSVTGGGTGAFIVVGANTFDTFSVGAPKTVTWPSATTQTFSRFIAVGSAGNLITLNVSTPGSAATLAVSASAPVPQVSGDYWSVQDITASTATSWYAGTHSTNVSGNTNVNFSFATTTRTISAAGGNYSSTAAWLEGAVPTSGSDIVAYPGSGNLTIDSSVTCRNLDLISYAGLLTYNSQLAAAPTAGGIVRFASGMTATGGSTQAILPSGVANVPLWTLGAVIPRYNLAGSTTGGVVFQDANSCSSGWTLSAGTLNTNGQSCTWLLFASTAGSTRTLTLGSSQITITGSSATVWNVSSTTMTANTATVTFTGAAAIGNFGSVNLNGLSAAFVGSGAAAVQGTSSTFLNFSRIGTATKTDSLILSVSIAATGTVTLRGNSDTNRLLVASQVLGQTLGITALGGFVLDDVDLTDIALADPTNLIPNPSFETGSCSPTVRGDFGVTLVASTAQADSGSFSGYLSGTTTNSGYGEVSAWTPVHVTPATPGQAYTFSARVYPTILPAGGLNNGKIIVSIQFLDANGANLLQSSPGVVATMNAWQRVSVTATAPAGTVWVRAGIVLWDAINLSGTAAGYVDSYQLTATASAQPYAETSIAGTSLGDAGGNWGVVFDPSTTQTWNGDSTGNWSDPTKWGTDLHPNPVPTSTTGYTGGGTAGTVTLDATQGYAAGTSIRSISNGAGTMGFPYDSPTSAGMTPVTPGQVVSAGAYLKADAAYGDAWRMWTYWYDASLSFLSSVASPVSVAPSTAWQLVSNLNQTAPAGAAWARIVVVRQSAAAGEAVNAGAFVTVLGATLPRVPLPQDDVRIPNLTSGTVSLDLPRAGRSVSFNGSSGGTLVWGAAGNNTTPQFFGNFTLVAGLTLGSFSNFIPGGRGSFGITSAGRAFPPNVIFACPGGTYTLNDAFNTQGNTGLQLQNGTVTATSDVTMKAGFTVSTGTTLNMGTGTWTVNGTGGGGQTTTPVNVNTTAVINAGASTIKLTDTGATNKTFVGGNATFHNVTITGGGTGAWIFTGSNTFNDLTIGGPKTVTFTAGTTQAFARLLASGTAGNVVTFNSSTPGTPYTLQTSSPSSPPVSLDYVSVRDSTAAGQVPFYVGPNSTLVSGNTNWVALGPGVGPPPSTTEPLISRLLGPPSSFATTTTKTTTSHILAESPE